jgi:hypothetical protein
MALHPKQPAERNEPRKTRTMSKLRGPKRRELSNKLKIRDGWFSSSAEPTAIGQGGNKTRERWVVSIEDNDVGRAGTAGEIRPISGSRVSRQAARALLEPWDRNPPASPLDFTRRCPACFHTSHPSHKVEVDANEPDEPGALESHKRRRKLGDPTGAGADGRELFQAADPQFALRVSPAGIGGLAPSASRSNPSSRAADGAS